MRYAKVVTDTLAVHEDPGGKIVGWLHQDEQVRLVGGPTQHARKWWQVERLTTGEVFRGWVAEGDGTAVWLEIDPDVPKPLPKMPPIPSGRPAIPPPSPLWPGVLIIAGIVITVLIAWAIH